MAKLLTVTAVKCDNHATATGKDRREWVEIRFKDEAGKYVRSDARQEMRPAHVFQVWKFLKDSDPSLEAHPAMIALNTAIVKGISAKPASAAKSEIRETEL